jgi:UDP-N-acetylglucosamine:LPS N-acetylglucosamine transferase
VERQLAAFGRVYLVDESNRERPWRVVKTIGRCVSIMRRERPAVVVSTGAAVGCIAALVGKLMGARVVWIDSIANVDKLSLSGRLVHPFADLTLTQWPDLVRKYKRVEYAGRIV